MALGICEFVFTTEYIEHRLVKIKLKHELENKVVEKDKIIKHRIH